MAEVNRKRVLLGGLAGGAVWVVWSGLVNVVFLGKHYAAMMQGGGGLLTEPRYPFFLPVYFLSLLVGGGSWRASTRGSGRPSAPARGRP